MVKSSILKRQSLLLKQELKSKVPVPIPKRYSMLIKGFYRISNIIYNLENGNYKYYLSDYARHKTKSINGSYAILLKNKVLFESVFRELLPVSRNVAIIDNGLISGIGDYKVNDYHSLLNHLKKKLAVVLKPITGTGGAGILVVKWQEGIFINNKKISSNEFKDKVMNLDNYFVNEYIEQSDFENELNDTSLNTIRVVTMKDIDTGTAFIPAAVQRIGNMVSSPTDNWTQGGLSCWIDIDKGVLSKGVTHPGNDDVLKWYKNHPDNGAQIEGKTIPNWNYIKEVLLEAVNKSPFLEYVGWDVVVTNDGFRVIEGNSMPDVNLLQVHRPLLKDERVRKFYKHYKIL